MKKTLLTALLLATFSLCGFSQTGIFSGGLSNRTLRETGLVIRPELGIVAARYMRPGVSLDCHIGYQQSPHFYVGGGMGFSVEPTSRYNPYTGESGFNNSEWIYASVRWYWLDMRSSPFLELNLGIGRWDYNRYTYNYYYDYDDYYYYDDNYYYRTTGIMPFISLDLGYNIRNFDVKLGVGDYSNFDYGWGCRLTVGYNFLK